MQMSMMFFLPNLLLSGFIFPFLGMPRWAQVIGEFLPLTHYMRIVRSIMLKGATLAELQFDILALSVTREIERGTMESLLAMPITPFEIMLGKIAPYVLVGFVQAALILFAGVLMFGVPIVGNFALLAALTTLFIATNLSFGYTFSTLAQNQLQAVQMAMMYFLPNMLLSGFLFPFAGMPKWAQYVGETLPLTHYVRIVRAIMLKGATLADLHVDALALVALMGVAMTIAVTRFRRTLD
jgi:ABC-2 type transport system permease protein